jgi:hypothetical protein
MKTSIPAVFTCFLMFLPISLGFGYYAWQISGFITAAMH